MRSAVPSRSPISLLYGRRPKGHGERRRLRLRLLDAQGRRAPTPRLIWIGPDTFVGADQRVSAFSSAGGKGCPVGVAGHAGIEPVRISRPSLTSCPNDCDWPPRPFGTGAIRAGQPGSSLVSRRGAPRLAPDYRSGCRCRFPVTSPARAALAVRCSGPRRRQPPQVPEIVPCDDVPSAVSSYGRGRSRHWLAARVGRPPDLGRRAVELPRWLLPPSPVRRHDGKRGSATCHTGFQQSAVPRCTGPCSRPFVTVTNVLPWSVPTLVGRTEGCRRRESQMGSSMVRYKVRPIGQTRTKPSSRPSTSSSPASGRRVSITRPSSFPTASASCMSCSRRDQPGGILGKVDAFKAFTAEIEARCEEPPVATELMLVGSYGVAVPD